MRKFEQKFVDEGVIGGTHSFGIFLVDAETQQRVFDEDVFEGFIKLNATGYYVKLINRDEQQLPWGGMVTKIDDDHVYIEGTPVPKSEFHSHYGLD